MQTSTRLADFFHRSTPECALAAARPGPKFDIGGSPFPLPNLSSIQIEQSRYRSDRFRGCSKASVSGGAASPRRPGRGAFGESAYLAEALLVVLICICQYKIWQASWSIYEIEEDGKLAAEAFAWHSQGERPWRC